MKNCRGMKACLRLLLLVVVTGLLLACGGDDTDETAPALSMNALDSASTTVRSHALTGTVEPGTTVEVTVDTTAAVSNLLVDNGLWSCTVDALAPGVNTLNVKATDPAGNQTTLGFTLVYDALSIESFVTPIRDGVAGLTIGGLFDPLLDRSELIITLGTATLPNTLFIANNDRWSVALNNLADGDNVVKLSLPVPGMASPLERSVTINVNANAPVVTIDSISVPDPSGISTVSGSVSAGVPAAVAAQTATVTNLTQTPGAPNDTWNCTLSGLDRGKNPFTAAATANGVTAVARDLIVVP